MKEAKRTTNRRRGFFDFGGCGCCLVLPALYIVAMPFIWIIRAFENRTRKPPPVEKPPSKGEVFDVEMKPLSEFDERKE